jgi:P pilus assembly chaperone PapD
MLSRTDLTFTHRSVFACVILLLAWSVGLSTYAQVVVAPKLVNLSDEERFASVFVENRTNRPQEVLLEFKFGYPVTDSLGSVSMHYGDQEAADSLAVGQFIRPYPQRFLLPPGQRQRVRLALRPPDDLPDGMYWTRLAFTASQYQQDSPPSAKAAVETKINYRFRQVISVFYRHGSLETGLRFRKMRSSRDPDNIYITSRVERTGNAPYLGTALLEVVDDSTGTVVATQENKAAVYFDMTHRFAVPRPDLTAGTYRATVTYETRRKDVASSDLVPASPASRTLIFAIN